MAGLSVYSSLERARLTAAKYPVRGRFIATVLVDDESPISVRKTLGAEHYSLSGEPAYFLAAVISVTPAE